jgi:phosphohistidine swiveling domain-containing protein
MDKDIAGPESPYEWSFSEETQQKFGQLLNGIDSGFMYSEDRQDPEFRLTVLMDQLGDVARHTSHDPTRNPRTRPLTEDPEVAFGDALWQMMCVGWSQGIDVDEALDVALERMESQEGYKQQSETELKGHVAHKPDRHEAIEGVVGQSVRVFREFDPDSHEWDGASVILTEIGGVTCHGAIIARENDVPCVVGIKRLNDHVTSGDRVSVSFTDGTVEVTD